ncbi:transglycosylase domain-containing protein [Paraflavitalea speifideaquila]|uniref:transglycosylase domain-containing protein n=1 Tax=Paraflavitalea speifideaquila TaxID=3076558 RepID=UPI0028E2E607|nr:transglycosylase domain-containing protein [Paraflavitalea speifideiaquila]
MEWKYSKDEILQLYLNLVPYGGNIEGVKAPLFCILIRTPTTFRWRRSQLYPSFPTAPPRW